MQICQYEVSAHMEFISKKQNETDQGMSREGSFIQNISWFSSRGEKRAYETHEIEFIMLRSLITWLYGYKIARRCVWLKFWESYVLTQSLR